jgi:hypothetical protein
MAFVVVKESEAAFLGDFEYIFLVLLSAGGLPEAAAADEVEGGRRSCLAQQCHSRLLRLGNLGIEGRGGGVVDRDTLERIPTFLPAALAYSVTGLN